MADHTSRGRTENLRRVTRFLVTVVCLGYVVYFLYQEREVLQEAASLPMEQLGAVIALLVAYFFFYSYRFVLLVDKHCNCRIGLIPWVRMSVVMRLLNCVFPQAGTVYRGTHLKKTFGVSYTDYITANVFFIWSDTVFNFVIAAVLLWWSHYDLSIGGVSLRVTLLVFALALFVLPFVARMLIPRAGTGALQFVVRKCKEVSDGILLGISDLRYFIAIHIVALISFVLMAEIFSVLFRATGQEVSFPVLAVFYALYRLTFHVSITPGNIGIRELAYGLLSQMADVGMAEGVIVSALLRVLSTLVLIGLGVILGSREIAEYCRERSFLRQKT